MDISLKTILGDGNSKLYKVKNDAFELQIKLQERNFIEKMTVPAVRTN